MVDGWQHSGAFVIRFSPNTDPKLERFCGRAEHVASGEILRFTSQGELFEFMSRILEGVREKFERADTLAEDFRSKS